MKLFIAITAVFIASCSMRVDYDIEITSNYEYADFLITHEMRY